MTLENIILYPRAYNKRGDESLHSVQGVTASGEEVNVKLRIPANAKIIGPKPSIAEFARDDYGAKNVCIATPDNGPDQPGGMLLFTGCEPDGENRKGIPSYIARWAHRLVADGEAPAPIQGLGRIDVSELTSKNRGLLTDIKALQEAKPAGWESRVQSLEAQLRNAVDFQYQLRMYRTGETTSFSLADREGWEAHFKALLDSRKVAGGVSGVYLRVRLEGGKFLPEVSSEMVPLWMPKGRYQSGDEVLQWLYRKNPELPGLGDDAQIVMVPIDCHTAGAVFRKHYGTPERYHRLRQQYYPGDRPELCHIVASQSLHDGEPMLLRVHPLSAPLASPMKLDEKGKLTSLMVGEEILEAAASGAPVEAGLNGFAPIHFPDWFKPVRVVVDESDMAHLPDAEIETDQLSQQSENVLEPEEPDEMVIIDDIYDLVMEEASPPSPGVEPQASVVSDPQMIEEPVLPENESRALDDPEPVIEVMDTVEPESEDGFSKESVSSSLVDENIELDSLSAKEEVVLGAPEPSAEPEPAIPEPFIEPEGSQRLNDEPAEPAKAPEIEALGETPEDALKLPDSQPHEDPEPILISDESLDEALEPEPTLPAQSDPVSPSSQSANADKPKPKGLARFMAKKGLIN